MRAVGVIRYGGPEALKQVELPTPEPDAGQVRVRVQAAAVNPADVQLRDGSLARWQVGQEPPFIPGASTPFSTQPHCTKGSSRRCGTEADLPRCAAGQVTRALALPSSLSWSAIAPLTKPPSSAYVSRSKRDCCRSMSPQRIPQQKPWRRTASSK